MDTKDLLFRAKEFIREDYYLYFEKYCEKYEINTALRLAHFLSQINHESGDMKRLEENLNYSAKRLLEIFPKYFYTYEIALTYANKPKMIASRVYANRMGNGDEASGDGYKYRGRGLIMLTGKSNYMNFSKWLGIGDMLVKKPDFVIENKEYTVLTALYYWTTRKINNLIIANSEQYDVCKKVTKVINGGYNGLDDRWQRFKKYYSKINLEK